MKAIVLMLLCASCAYGQVLGDPSDDLFSGKWEDICASQTVVPEPQHWSIVGGVLLAGYAILRRRFA